MKRSSKVALLLMGVTGVGATGYAMTKPPQQLRAAGQPSVQRRCARRTRHRAVSAPAAVVVIVGLQLPLDLDENQQQFHWWLLAGVFTDRNIDNVLDVGAVFRQFLDQFRPVAQRSEHDHARRFRFELRLVFALVGQLMRRVACEERPNWRDIAREMGFDFHTMDDTPYWVESAYYAFTLEQIERDIEAPTAELEAMCRELVAKAIDDERIMNMMQIPRPFWNWIARKFQEPRAEPLWPLRPALQRQGPRQAAGVQRRHADLGVRDRRVPMEMVGGRNRSQGAAGGRRSVQLAARSPDRRLEGDRQRARRALRRRPGKRRGCRHARLHRRLCAAGRARDQAHRDEGHRQGRAKRLRRPRQQADRTDVQTLPVGMDDARSVRRVAAGRTDPVRRASLEGNPFQQGILPLLWAMFPNHPNLLPAYFEGDEKVAELGNSYVRKPLYSREGANIELIVDGKAVDRDDGPYGAEGFIRQAIAPLPEFDGNYTVLGSWFAAGEPCGLNVREDASPITKNSSRFLPHAIVG